MTRAIASTQKSKAKTKTENTKRLEDETVDLEVDLSVLKVKVAQLEDENMKLRAESEDKDEIVENTKKKVEELELKVELLEEENKSEGRSHDKENITPSEKNGMVKKVEHHRDQLIAGMKKLRERLNRLKEDHEKTIEDTKQTHQKQVSMITAVNDKKINDLLKQAKESSSKISELQDQYSKLETTKQAEVELLKNEMKAVSERAQAYKADMVKRIKQLESQLTTERLLKQKSEDATVDAVKTKQKLTITLKEKNDAIKALREKLGSAETKTSAQLSSLREKTKDVGRMRLKINKLISEVAELTKKHEFAQDCLYESRQEFEQTSDDLKEKLKQKAVALNSISEKFENLRETKNQSMEKVKMLTTRIEELKKEHKVSTAVVNKKTGALKTQIKALEKKIRTTLASNMALNKNICTTEREKKVALGRLTKELNINIALVSRQAKKIIDLKAELQKQTEIANEAKIKRDETINEVQVELGRMVNLIENKIVEENNLREKLEIVNEKLAKASEAANEKDLKIKKAEQVWKKEKEKHHLLLKAKDAEVAQCKERETKLKESFESLKTEKLKINREIASVTKGFVGAKPKAKTIEKIKATCNKASEQDPTLEGEKTLLNQNLTKIKAFAKDLTEQISEKEKAMKSMQTTVTQLETKIETVTKEKSWKEKCLQQTRALGAEDKKLQAKLKNIVDAESSKRRLAEAKSSALEAALNNREKMLKEAKIKLKVWESTHKSEEEDHQAEIEGYEEAIREKISVINDLKAKLDTRLSLAGSFGPPPMQPPRMLYH